ncbi:MAG TPA: ATP-binding cassette domain-containing protein [Solirubrobacteraceae bacterium]|jgi:ABC-type lipoprotein export system ATPase subunit|nr:ATP-binding cassette domain-containing protein [Solirubrobacteraceae bacterium]
MSVLALQSVSKRHRDRRRERIVLDEVSLEITPGELAVVYGPRRSGRTTLLRIAAGIQPPDSGRVLFNGQDLNGLNSLGAGIGFVLPLLRAAEEQGVLEQISTPLLARGVSVSDAREQARGGLALVDAQDSSGLLVGELSPGEAIRVAIARALVLSPSLLILDEPTASVPLSERDPILTLLRKLPAHGFSVLSSTSEPTELAGAHRAFTLSDGKLRGPDAPDLAPVVALRRSI